MDVAALERQVDLKPAPMPLLVVQALADTLDVEAGEDDLGSPAELARWLREMGLATPDLTVSEPELERAVALRATLRELMHANAHGGLERSVAAALDEQVGLTPVPLAVDGEGHLTLDLSPAPDVDGFVARVLGIVFEAETRGQWRRLKLCRNPDCVWAYYDASRNRGGAWCEMGVCGNRLKNRRYRRRRAASGSPAAAR